jgi:uncharacterized protein (TIGR02246 family)
MRRLALLIGCLALIAGCGGPGTPDELRAEVLDADREFSRAVAMNDLEKFSSFIAEDAVFYGMGEVAEGREQIVEQWEPLLDADRLTELSWVPEHAEVAASGDLAVTRGHYRITGHVAEEESGDVKGYYVTVWRRADDGSWIVVCDVGTPPGT